MKIAIVGAGGIGGYFGGLLAAAGADVHFLVRPRTLQALHERGLRIESAVTPLHLPAVQANADPAAIGAADLVIFAVKLPDARQAATGLGPLIGPHTVVIPFQNGVEASGLLAAALPGAAIASGVAYIAAALREPGVVIHGGPFARLRFGPREAAQRAPLAAFEAVCRQAGIDVQLLDDIARTIWEKFVFLVGLSAMTGVTRRPIGVIRADPLMRSVLRTVMQETCAVAHAEGAGLPADFIEERMAFVDTLPDTMKASMLHDLEAGRRLELPWLSGAVVRLGERHGIATPVNQTIVAALTPHVAGASPDEAADRAPAAGH